MSNSTTQAYIDIDSLKQSTGMTGFDYANLDMETAVVAASRAIDNLCNRMPFGFLSVGTADEPVTRYYIPEHARKLNVDDLQSVVALATDDNADGTYSTVWLPTDYQLRRAGRLNADDWPYDEITVDRNRGTQYFNNVAEIPVQIQGVWGWPAVPEAISLATGIIAQRLVRLARDAPFGVVAFEGQALRLSQQDPNVRFLVGPYRAHRVAVA